MRTKLLAVLALVAIAWALYAEYRVYRAVGIGLELAAIADELMTWPEELEGYRKVCQREGAELAAIQVRVEIVGDMVLPGAGRFLCVRPQQAGPAPSELPPGMLKAYP